MQYYCVVVARGLATGGWYSLTSVDPACCVQGLEAVEHLAADVESGCCVQASRTAGGGEPEVENRGAKKGHDEDRDRQPPEVLAAKVNHLREGRQSSSIMRNGTAKEVSAPRVKAPEEAQEREEPSEGGASRHTRNGKADFSSRGLPCRESLGKDGRTEERKDGRTGGRADKARQGGGRVHNLWKALHASQCV